MAEFSANPFAFIMRLPDATVTPPFEKHPGVFIQAGLVEGEGHNVVFEKVSGEGFAKTYTLNIGGRGALVFGEQEFRDLLSAGLALFELGQTGRAEPTSTARASGE